MLRDNDFLQSGGKICAFQHVCKEEDQPEQIRHTHASTHIDEIKRDDPLEAIRNCPAGSVDPTHTNTHTPGTRTFRVVLQPAGG